MATRHRMYDADLGTWLSEDRIARTGGESPCGYVVGNPIKDVDPGGALQVPTSVAMAFRVLMSIACVLAAGCSASWEEHESAWGRFRIALPGAAKETFNKLSAADLTVMFEGVEGDTSRKANPWVNQMTCRALAGDISTVPVSGRGDLVAAMVRARTDQYRTFKDARVLSETAWSGRQCSGTEIEVAFGLLRSRERFCMRGDRLYHLAVIGPEGTTKGRDAARCLESFRAW